jgi:hypothetical protein
MQEGEKYLLRKLFDARRSHFFEMPVADRVFICLRSCRAEHDDRTRTLALTVLDNYGCPSFKTLYFDHACLYEKLKRLDHRSRINPF